MIFDGIVMVSPIVMGSPASAETATRQKTDAHNTLRFTKPPEYESIGERVLAIAYGQYATMLRKFATKRGKFY
jgi:hypothetical protein